MTAQYTELMKMAAKFNIYQLNINKTLQKTIQKVREDAFAQISSKGMKTIQNQDANQGKNNFEADHWHVIQSRGLKYYTRIRLRLRIRVRLF